MASSSSKSKKPLKRGRGRPKTDVVWKGIGVRFTAEEKARVEKTALAVRLPQAELVRRGALLLCNQVEKTGSFEVEVL